MYIRGFNKKIFFICFLLSQGTAKANWESLYEEYEYSDNKNLYLYPIDVNVSYAFNYSTRFKSLEIKNNGGISSVDENILFPEKGGSRNRNLKSFLNHGIRFDAGVLMTGYGFAKKFFCFPRFGLIYQHLFFPMKLKENGFVDDFIFYFSPVSSPTAFFEVAPRIGIGLSYIYLPREYYSKLQKVEDGYDENGNRRYKILNDRVVQNFLCDGIDLAFVYELIFKLRFVPEWTIFATIGGVWRPLLYKQGVFKGIRESNLIKNSFDEQTLQSIKVIDGGLGTLGATLGFNYNFKPALEKPEWYNKILRKNDKKVRFRLETIFGGRSRYENEEINREGSTDEVEVVKKREKNGIIGGDLKTLLQFSNWQALGVGVGVVADFAREAEIKPLPATTEFVNIHVSLIHDFIYNKLILENALGVNVKKGDKMGLGVENQKGFLGRIFWKPSLLVKFNDYFFLGIGAKVGVFSAPIEFSDVEQFEMKDLKNKADILKFEYLSLSLGIDWVLEPSVEYYD